MSGDDPFNPTLETPTSEYNVALATAFYVNNLRILINNTIWQRILVKRDNLIGDGCRHRVVKTCGDTLPVCVDKANDFLALLPEDRKWNSEEIKDLKELCEQVKDEISGLRYEQ